MAAVYINMIWLKQKTGDVLRLFLKRKDACFLGRERIKREKRSKRLLVLY